MNKKDNKVGILKDNAIELNFIENVIQMHKIEIIFNIPDKLHEFILMCKKARKVIEERNQIKLLEMRNEYYNN